MTDASPKRTVVVGFDGSSAARSAVDHAIARTGEGGHLVVVHAFRAPPDSVGRPGYERAAGDATAQTVAIIDRLERDCPGLQDVDYEADVLEGRPAEVLCRVAELRGADELVIGSRGAGRVRALLGSVAHEALHRSTCPVTVIPERVARRRATARRASATPA